MGQPNLTDEQFEVLAVYYRDPKIPGNVMWTKFLTDTEVGKLLITGRQCGPVVRTLQLALRSGLSVLKTRSNHSLNLFLVVPGSTSRPRL